MTSLPGYDQFARLWPVCQVMTSVLIRVTVLQYCAQYCRLSPCYQLYKTTIIVRVPKETWLPLTHWGRVMHICVDNLNIIVSDNGLSPGRHQAIIWTNAGILLIGPLGTNSSEIAIRIQIFSFKKMHLKMASTKRRPFCLGLNVLTHLPLDALLNWVIIDLDNGLSPVQCQAIIWTSDDLSLIASQTTVFSDKLTWVTNFHSWITPELVVWKFAAILVRGG